MACTIPQLFLCACLHGSIEGTDRPLKVQAEPAEHGLPIGLHSACSFVLGCVPFCNKILTLSLGKGEVSGVKYNDQY